MVSVRAAMEQDAGAISHVHVQSWRTTYIGMVPESYLAGLDETKGVLQWREWLTRDVPVLVAEVDGEIVGFVSGGPLRESVGVTDAADSRRNPAQGGEPGDQKDQIAELFDERFEERKIEADGQ